MTKYIVETKLTQKELEKLIGEHSKKVLVSTIPNSFLEQLKFKITNYGYTLHGQYDGSDWSTEIKKECIKIEFENEEVAEFNSFEEVEKIMSTTNQKFKNVSKFIGGDKAKEKIKKEVSKFEKEFLKPYGIEKIVRFDYIINGEYKEQDWEWFVEFDKYSIEVELKDGKQVTVDYLDHLKNHLEEPHSTQIDEEYLDNGFYEIIEKAEELTQRTLHILKKAL